MDFQKIISNENLPMCLQMKAIRLNPILTYPGPPIHTTATCQQTEGH